jgi:putative DNA primase/helicase
MIGRPPGTIEDRSILVELRRKSAGESVARLRLDRIEAETVSIRQSLRRWANDHLDELREADPAVPASLNDRAQDNYRPLLALADAIGGPWPARARAAALALGGDEAAEDARTELLADIKVVFEAADNPVVMASADIIKGLVDMEDRPWSEWSKGKPITGSKLARTLKSFQVTAAGTVRIGTKTAKGYRLEAFTDAFERYLPRNSVFKASHRNNPNETGPESTIPKSHTVEACDGLESAVHARKHCACYGVTLPNGVSGEVDHEVLPAWVTEASEPDPGDPIGERDEDD